MATYAYPATLKPEGYDYAVEFDVQLNVSRNGRITTYGLPGARWTCTLTYPADAEHITRPALEALLVSLEGGVNRLALPHFGRPYPNGTMRGAPTVAITAAAGAKTISLASANGTLKAGDILGIGGQWVMVKDDTASTAGSMNVNFMPALRAQASAGASVVWNKPTALFVPRTSAADRKSVV